VSGIDAPGMTVLGTIGDPARGKEIGNSLLSKAMARRCSFPDPRCNAFPYSLGKQQDTVSLDVME
jgi:hypothetical protein